MLGKKPTRSKKIFVVILLVALLSAALVGGWWFRQNPESETMSQKASEDVRRPVQSQTVIDTDKMEKNREIQALMDTRKSEYGIEKGIDIIVKSDESLKIDDSTVSMQEILDKIQLKKGDIVEKDVLSTAALPSEDQEFFGIHMVQPGENIWNIHFEFLKDYFSRRGITLSRFSDEPLPSGNSSGVGKLLKFSEQMVSIYNLKDRRLDMDLHVLQPLSKIVVFNLGQVFALLDQIDYNDVNRIQFDGETIWIPATQ
jgi:hypothetical protein